jgi:Immunity protein Imm1
MKKRSYFPWDNTPGWPKPEELEPYFLAAVSEGFLFEMDNDSAILQGEGADGTEHLPAGNGRIYIHLEMWGNPDHGVLLIWSKWGGGHELTYTSKGDMPRMREFVFDRHGTPLPVAFFIPFEKGWKAVKEFLETEGAFPECIEWVANDDLPPNSFPDPTDFTHPPGGVRNS